MIFKYDALIVLGSQPDPDSLEFPKQIYQCLDRTAELMHESIGNFVVTSGDRSIALDNLRFVQPFRECDELANYLIEHGVDESKILKEGDSRDSISNLYYLKKNILMPNNMTKILIIVASFRIERLRFLCERILGETYDVSFEPIRTEEGSTYNEQHTIRIQSEFLKNMKPGNHEWLSDKFYTAPIYQYWKAHDRKKYYK